MCIDYNNASRHKYSYFIEDGFGLIQNIELAWLHISWGDWIYPLSGKVDWKLVKECWKWVTLSASVLNGIEKKDPWSRHK